MSQSLEAVFLQGDQQPRYDYIPEADLSCGAVVYLGGIVGIVTTTEGIAANRLGSLATNGIFKLKKASGVTFSRGDVAEWDDTDNTSKNATQGDFKTGVVVEDAASADDHVKVEINRAPLN